MCVIASCGCGNLHEHKGRKQDGRGAEWGVQLQGAAQLCKRAKQASQQQQRGLNDAAVGRSVAEAQCSHVHAKHVKMLHKRLT